MPDRRACSWLTSATRPGARATATTRGARSGGPRRRCSPNGAARGTLPPGDPHHFHLTRRYAFNNADVILIVGTPFDFRTPKLIGRDIDVPDEQMGNIGGYGHNYWINGKKRETLFGRDLMVHAEASCAGLTLRVSSDMPCDQFYTSTNLHGPIPFKGGVKQHKRQAICIEPQYEPDSPTYERTILRRGEKYDYMTVFTFESAE